MGPIGHFAVGLFCGILIMLPFLRDRSMYDYEHQRWVSIEWIPYIKRDLTTNGIKLFTTQKTSESLITSELNPLTRSKFLTWMPVIAIACGFLSMIPDISHLWGDSALDRSRFADLFFFHRTIDIFFAEKGFSVTSSLNVELPLMLMTASLMICLMAVAQNFQYNKHNYENCVI